MRETDRVLTLTPVEQKELLQIARLSLESHVRKRPFPPSNPTKSALWQQAGIFVTLWLHNDKKPPAYWPQGHLRGCVGYLQSDIPLHELAAKTAVEAAVSDPRFPPLTLSELPHVHIEISVLSPLHQLYALDEIEIGKHGLFITNGVQKGLLLPKVAKNRQWNRHQFMQNVCQKAGIPQTAWPDGAKLFTFKTVEFAEDHPNC